MKSEVFNKSQGRILATLLLLSSLLFAVTSVAEDLPEARQQTNNSVIGPIQAVESDRGALIVEGRRFMLAEQIRMDNVKFARRDVLQRLSKGDQVILHRESINQDVIERIYTNLE